MSDKFESRLPKELTNDPKNLHCTNCKVSGETIVLFEGLPICLLCDRIAKHLKDKSDVYYALMRDTYTALLRTAIIRGNLHLPEATSPITNHRSIYANSKAGSHMHDTVHPLQGGEAGGDAAVSDRGHPASLHGGRGVRSVPEVQEGGDEGSSDTNPSDKEA